MPPSTNDAFELVPPPIVDVVEPVPSPDGEAFEHDEPNPPQEFGEDPI